MITLSCQHCSTRYQVRAYRKDISRYCSRKCQAQAQLTRGNTNCLTCGKYFEFISSRANTAKYCSNLCKGRATTAKAHTQFSCKHCGKIFNAPASTKRVYCSRDCYGKESADTWVPKYTTVRKALVRRGMLTSCERCGYKEEPKILGVHHKDRNRNNNTRSNLEVLCPNCHSLEHMKHTPHGFTE